MLNGSSFTLDILKTRRKHSFQSDLQQELKLSNIQELIIIMLPSSMSMQEKINNSQDLAESLHMLNSI